MYIVDCDRKELEISNKLSFPVDPTSIFATVKAKTLCTIIVHTMNSKEGTKNAIPL